MGEGLSEETVSAFLSDNEDDVLLNDGPTQLLLIREVHLGANVFGFSMVDGGGFSGIIVTVQEWESMKAKVDAYIAALADTQKDGGV